MIKEKKNYQINIGMAFGIIIAALFMVAPLFSGAQMQMTGLEDDVSIEIIPKYPGSNENVIVRIDGATTDMSRAEMTWVLNDKIILKGVGQESINFKTSSAGSVSYINLIIRTKDGGVINKDIVITPADVVLLWEAKTYTPPFYKGKALNSPESGVMITAMPNIIGSDGKKIPSKDLVYKWKVRDGIDSRNSGLGKNTYAIISEKVQAPVLIELEVKSFDERITAEGSVYLRIAEPKILIYKNDPLLGTLFNQAVGDAVDFKGEEMTLRAEPYFFSTDSMAKRDLEYSWKMNGKIFETENNKIILRGGGEQRGTSKFSININNARKIFQRAESAFLVNF